MPKDSTMICWVITIGLFDLLVITAKWSPSALVSICHSWSIWWVSFFPISRNFLVLRITRPYTQRTEHYFINKNKRESRHVFVVRDLVKLTLGISVPRWRHIPFPYVVLGWWARDKPVFETVWIVVLFFLGQSHELDEVSLYIHHGKPWTMTATLLVPSWIERPLSDVCRRKKINKTGG